jgi:hypothetical protein
MPALAVSAILLLTGRHRKPLERIGVSLAVPILGYMLVEAYGINSWLTKRYLITKSQKSSF